MRDSLGRYIPGHKENARRARDNAGRYAPRDGMHRVAVISDMHFGSIYQQPTRLGEFLDFAIHDRGCEMILCAGDVSDGLKMREGHETEVFLQSTDDIINYILEVYPDTGKRTAFITGNHDHSIWKRSGVDIGESLGRARNDLQYCGYTSADIVIPGGARVRLYHGSGGCGQNRSMRIQKRSVQALEECLSSGRAPPEMFLAGHCHYEAVVHSYYNMFIMSLPSFQMQTPYLREHGMIPQVGGVVLEYMADGEGLTGTPRVEYVQYAPIEGDYPGWKNQKV